MSEKGHPLKKIQVLAALASSFLIFGCGDPTMNFSGDPQVDKERLLSVVKSYDTPDKIAFMLWYRGTWRQQKMIDGKKASEIIKLVRLSWMDDYIRGNRSNLENAAYRISNSLNYIATPQNRLTAACSRNPDNPVTGDYQDEQSEIIKKEEEYFSHLDFSCSSSPDNRNSLLITIKNDNKIPLTGFSLFIGNNSVTYMEKEVVCRSLEHCFAPETEIPGGISYGETVTIEVKSDAAGKAEGKMGEDYECRPDHLVFYDPAVNRRIIVPVYQKNRNSYNFRDTAEYKDFVKDRIDYYNSLSGQHEVCEIIEPKLKQLTDSVISTVVKLTGITPEENQ